MSPASHCETLALDGNIFPLVDVNMVIDVVAPYWESGKEHAGYIFIYLLKCVWAYANASPTVFACVSPVAPVCWQAPGL